MAGWLKNLAGGLCILTVMMHLIPEGKFAKYVKFYAGLLFFLIAAQPVIRIFADEGELERLLRLEFAKGAQYDLQVAADSLAELKNDRILEAYRTEIKDRITEIAGVCRVDVYELQLEFYDQEPFQLKGIRMSVKTIYDTAIDDLRRELASLFVLAEHEIQIEKQEG